MTSADQQPVAGGSGYSMPKHNIDRTDNGDCRCGGADNDPSHIAGGSGAGMGNTYTIQGLRVPYLDSRFAELTAELAATRTLLKATADAIARVDADVVLILEALGVSRDH